MSKPGGFADFRSAGALHHLLMAGVLLFSFAVSAVAQPLGEAKTDRFRGEYVPPKNPAHQFVYDRLRQRNVLERLSEYLAPIKLPRELLIKLEGCDGEVNAFYEDGVVTVCYEYIDYIHANAPRKAVPRGLTTHDAVIGPTVDVFLHEVGHAVFDLLQIPVFGREEDAADTFAAYVQLQFMPAEARILILGNAFLGRTESQAMRRSPKMKDYANEHGLPAQRYYNTLCLAYGADPVLFADAVTTWGLPPDRAGQCADEYKQAARAFEKLIRPHVDADRLAAVKGKEWLRLDSKPSDARAGR
jgi:hypothetical protein